MQVCAPEMPPHMRVRTDMHVEYCCCCSKETNKFFFFYSLILSPAVLPPVKLVLDNPRTGPRK